MKEWKIDLIKPAFADLGDNEYICETAGFIPLEVKFKRFEENGIRAQFDTDSFSSSDLREIYLNPDFEIRQGDDLIDIEAKLTAREEYILSLNKEKSKQAENVDTSTKPDIIVGKKEEVKDNARNSEANS